ncbi:hypothetical protein [uncultured Clostridium sp.]|uniref:hypothetical protein n=1 Tax=uncultured Clostridium sp. TaxID=59620 RepID=UPI0025E05DB1|nr:hypothetical protein [uncultured Clostridium sp.]
MRKKVLVFTIVSGVFLLSYPLIPGNSLLSANAECIKDNIVINSDSNAQTNEQSEENNKVQNAINLFKNYLEDNSTDWHKVQYENLNRAPVKSLADYNINSAKLVDCQQNSFTVKIIYDVKSTEESDMWLAGNGKKDEDNWIRNKSNYITIENIQEEYKIKNIYT